MPRSHTRTAHCSNCCAPGGKAGWSLDYDNDWNRVWKCENCLATKPLITRKPRDVGSAKVEDATVAPPDAFTYGFDLAKEAGASESQAGAVGRIVRDLVGSVVLADGDTEVHVGHLSLYGVGSRLMVSAYGVCSASHKDSILEAYGRKLNGVMVGRRGGMEYSELENKRTKGWRADYAALA